MDPSRAPKTLSRRRANTTLRQIMFASAGVLIAMLSIAARADDGNTTIYKYIDSNGNIVFTDHPTKGAEKIKVNPPPPIPMTPVVIPESTPKPEPKPPAATAPETATQTPPPPPSAPPAQTTATTGTVQQLSPSGISQSPTTAPLPATQTPIPAQSASYQSLQVTSPRPGLQIPKPGGTIIVQLALTPGLNAAAGDRFRIVIDGTTMVDDSTSARHMISGLKPGAHTLIALVMRRRGTQDQSLIQSPPLTFELAKAPN